MRNDIVGRVSCSHGGSNDDGSEICSNDGDSSMKNALYVENDHSITLEFFL